MFSFNILLVPAKIHCASRRPRPRVRRAQREVRRTALLAQPCGLPSRATAAAAVACHAHHGDAHDHSSLQPARTDRPPRHSEEHGVGGPPGAWVVRHPGVVPPPHAAVPVMCGRAFACPFEGPAGIPLRDTLRLHAPSCGTESATGVFLPDVVVRQ
eukprot:gene13917-biopygen12538